MLRTKPRALCTLDKQSAPCNYVQPLVHETGSHSVAHDQHEFTMYAKRALNSCSSCPCLPRTGIIKSHIHTLFFLIFKGNQYESFRDDKFRDNPQFVLHSSEVMIKFENMCIKYWIFHEKKASCLKLSIFYFMLCPVTWRYKSLLLYLVFQFSMSSENYPSSREDFKH